MYIRKEDFSRKKFRRRENILFPEKFFLWKNLKKKRKNYKKIKNFKKIQKKIKKKL